MNKNDVLGVGAAGSIMLASSAWLAGYWNNKIISWVGLLLVVSIASSMAWFTKNKKSTYQEIAKQSAIYGAVMYITASILGLLLTRWAHGSWNPELITNAESFLGRIFNGFPMSYMKTILLPTLSTLLSGSLLTAIWSGLGASFLPIPEVKKSSSKKGRR